MNLQFDTMITLVQEGERGMEDDAARAERLQAWCAVTTEFFLAALESVSDDEFADQTALPGWSKATLVAHVHRNAEALIRLTSWVITGVPTPMYASPEARDHDIREASGWPSVKLRDAAHDSAERLAGAMRSVPETSWGFRVKTATGREIPASEIPWLRVREAAIHAVDLSSGSSLEVLPPEIVDAMIDDIVAFRDKRGEDPSCSIVANDGRSWAIGATAYDAAVHGSPTQILLWLSGRTTGAGLTPDGSSSVPTLSPWI